MEQLSQKELYDEWLDKIKTAEGRYSDYYKLISEIREYYRNDRKKNKQNIFWSSIETMKPFLYFKQPKPFIVRNNKKSDKVETTACKILERALAWDMRQFDFDSVIKYARNDFLLSGMGILWEQYRPTFQYIGDIIVKENEQVDTVYISPTDFLMDTEKVNVWEDVEWIARKTYLTYDELVYCFGEEVVNTFVISPDVVKGICVYEIWDKKTKRIYYLSPECYGHFLRVKEDTLHLSGFFPIPKPIMSTLSNDGIIPVPDYVEIKSLLEELDGVNERMRLLMQAIKVSGCYDNSFPVLANILNKDVTLVSVSDFDSLREVGGLKGILDFVPIEQYVTALQVLAERRKILIEAIYEVTGVSDIMRGNSSDKDTATAVMQKTNFGTLRNQDRQNDMQRFIRDLLKIKAEIICEQFSPEKLASFVSLNENISEEVINNAIKLLKTEKIREMTIEVETDASFNQAQEEEKILQVLQHIHTTINQAFAIVSQQPALLPLYRQMIEAAVATIPNARQFEGVMEDVFTNISNELNKPVQPNPVLQNDMIKLEQQKINQDFIIKKEQNQLKREELELKKITEQNKINLKK